MRKIQKLALAMGCALSVSGIAAGVYAMYSGTTKTTENIYTIKAGAAGETEQEKVGYVTEDKWKAEDATNLGPNQKIPKNPKFTSTAEYELWSIMQVDVPVAEFALGDGQAAVQDVVTLGGLDLDGWQLLGGITSDDPGLKSTYYYGYKTVLNKNDSTTELFQELQVPNISSLDENYTGSVDVTVHIIQAVGNPTVEDAFKNLGNGQGSTGQLPEGAYKISYMLNGGILSGAKTSYTADDYGYEPPVPVRDGYTFTGWTPEKIADGSAEPITFEAEWEEKQAMFTYGSAVNERMKQLAGDSGVGAFDSDTTITGFKKSDHSPDPNLMTKDHIVSAYESDLPIYMWFENGTIYWWSEAPTPRLHRNCGQMFASLEALETVDLSCFDASSVQSISYMFYRCRSLSALDLNNFGTADINNTEFMFFECSAPVLDLSNFDTSGITNMRNMFYGCKVSSLDLTNFDTSNVTDMSYMFYVCESSLDLSGFDTANVTDMSKMFFGYKGTQLDLSSFDTSSVTTMDTMFCNTQLVSVNLSSFDTSHVTTMMDLFAGSYNLSSLDLSSFDTSNVTNMWAMFCMCKGLTSLDLSMFDTSNVTEMYQMFAGCIDLETLDISNFDMTNVTNKREMFNAVGARVGLCKVYCPLAVRNEVISGADVDFLHVILVDSAGEFYERATIDAGKTFNGKIKRLSGNASADYTSQDTQIKAFLKSNSAPDFHAMTDDNIMSAENSRIPVYMWFDNGTIYWWSEDQYPALKN